MKSSLSTRPTVTYLDVGALGLLTRSDPERDDEETLGPERPQLVDRTLGEHHHAARDHDRTSREHSLQLRAHIGDQLVHCQSVGTIAGARGGVSS